MLGIGFNQSLIGLKIKSNTILKNIHQISLNHLLIVKTNLTQNSIFALKIQNKTNSLNSRNLVEKATKSIKVVFPQEINSTKTKRNGQIKTIALVIGQVMRRQPKARLHPSYPPRDPRQTRSLSTKASTNRWTQAVEERSGPKTNRCQYKRQKFNNSVIQNQKFLVSPVLVQTKEILSLKQKKKNLGLISTTPEVMPMIHQ